MARDNQTLTAGDGSTGNGTVAEYIAFQGGGAGIKPFARMVHRGFFDLDGSGVGDTADCRLSLPLPDQVVWQLDQLAFWTLATDDYITGAMEFFIAPTTVAFGASTQINYPFSPTVSVNPSDVAGSQQVYWGFFGSPLNPVNQAILGAAVTFDDPYRVINYQETSGGADPVIWISSQAETNATAGQARVYASWLGYNYEQFNSADVWTGLNQRG